MNEPERLPCSESTTNSVRKPCESQLGMTLMCDEVGPSEHPKSFGQQPNYLDAFQPELTEFSLSEPHL